MSDRYERTVLITGANSGIGLATVLHVAKLGFRAVGSVRSGAKAKLVDEAAAGAGVSVDTVLLDVTSAQSCGRVIGELRPWAVVNNAGYGPVGAIEDVGDNEARQQLETMVLGPIRLARLALPHMRAIGGGRIVNVSSIYGRTTTPLTGWYQASKHALEAVSDALRVEVARDGISVMLIEPGGFKTAIWEDLEGVLSRRAGSEYEASYRRLDGMIKSFTMFMGEPEGVAKAIGKALTASNPRARYLVGRDAQVVAATQQLLTTGVKDRIARLFVGL